MMMHRRERSEATDQSPAVLGSAAAKIRRLGRSTVRLYGTICVHRRILVSDVRSEEATDAIGQTLRGCLHGKMPSRSSGPSASHRAFTFEIDLR